MIGLHIQCGVGLAERLRIGPLYRMGKTKIIIDTDAGTDDATAIFMALASHRNKELEVIAITTVQGNTEVHNVSVNVQRILHTVNMTEIPVYEGACKSLVKPWNFANNTFHGSDGFGDAALPPLDPPPPPLQKQHAVWALLELVKKYPNEIVLAALGPLTNLALAINLDPSFTSRLLGLYVMGGNISGRGNTTVSSAAEFNFGCDPEAAQVVLQESCIPIHLTCWETTIDPCGLPVSVREELGAIKSPVAELLNKIEAKNKDMKLYNKWLACDGVVMAWIIDDIKNGKLQRGTGCSDMNNYENCLATSVKSIYASVELSGEYTRGQLAIDHMKLVKRKPNINLLVDVNVPRLLQYLRMAFGDKFESSTSNGF